MGGEPNRNRIVTGSLWQLVTFLAAALGESERDAVLGDLTESRESGGRALWEVAGLVLRRQAAAWADWRAWAVMAGTVMPLCLVISVFSRGVSVEAAVYTWMYANNSDLNLLRNWGFWYVLADACSVILIRGLILVGWAWTIGFVTGASSRRFLRASAVGLFASLLFCESLAAPLYLSALQNYIQRTLGLSSLPPGNDPVFHSPFYRVMFPLIVQIALVWLPAMWGMRQSIQTRNQSAIFRSLFWILVAVALAVLALRDPGLAFLFASYKRPMLQYIREMKLLQFASCWPLAFFMVMAVHRRFQAVRKEKILASGS